MEARQLVEGLSLRVHTPSWAGVILNGGRPRKPCHAGSRKEIIMHTMSIGMAISQIPLIFRSCVGERSKTPVGRSLGQGIGKGSGPRIGEGSRRRSTNVGEGLRGARVGGAIRHLRPGGVLGGSAHVVRRLPWQYDDEEERRECEEGCSDGEGECPTTRLVEEAAEGDTTVREGRGRRRGGEPPRVIPRSEKAMEGGEVGSRRW